MNKWFWAVLTTASLVFFSCSKNESATVVKENNLADTVVQVIEKKTDPSIYPIFSDVYGGGSIFKFENGEAVKDSDTTLMVWGNTCIVKAVNSDAFAGNSSLYLTIAPGGNWFGFGFHKENPVSKDMSGFENGHLKFALKATPQSGDVKILIKHDRQTESWLFLDAYGMTNDNQWHQISLPIADFIPKIKIKEVNIFFGMAQGKNYKMLSKYWIDEIVWTKN